MLRRARRRFRMRVACQRRKSATPMSSAPAPRSAIIGNGVAVSGAEAPSRKTASESASLSEVSTARRGLGSEPGPATVEMTEGLALLANAESMAPSEESMCVGLPGSVREPWAPMGAAGVAARGVESMSMAFGGTNAAVNCAAAGNGATARAKAHTATAEILTRVLQARFDAALAGAVGHFRCHATRRFRPRGETYR